MAPTEAKKRSFKMRNCAVCGALFQATGTRNAWCSLKCRIAVSIDASAGPEACWPYLKCTDGHEYGSFRYQRRCFPAHRIAYMAHHDIELSPDQVVRHSCDNPICCNPAHLMIGTQADNVSDMLKRGRAQDYSHQPVGSDHHRAKVNEPTALAIFKSRSSLNAIARRFQVSRDIVERIKYGYTWTHVTGMRRRPMRARR